jgi:hypothetical protein
MVLTQDQVVEIYMTQFREGHCAPIPKLSAKMVSQSYGVSEKTIRDVWKRRTWIRETSHLDPDSREKGLLQPLRVPGRPKGSKDGQKRNKGHRRHPCSQSREKTSAIEFQSGLEVDSEFDQLGKDQRLEAPDDIQIQGAESRNPYHSSTECFLASTNEPYLRLLPHHEVDPLPHSSRPDDPFHDDWISCKHSLQTAITPKPPWWFRGFN